MSDFGDGRHLAGRKDHRCEACFALIPKGETHYLYSGMYDGEWQHWRMHEECFDDYDAGGVGEFTSGGYPVPDAVEARLFVRKALAKT